MTVNPTTAAAPSALAGMLLMVLAMSIIPVMDGLAKSLTDRYPTLQIVWARYFFHVALFLPLVLLYYGRRTFRLQRPGVQLLRSAALLFSTICFFSAIRDLPLTDTLAMVFIYPFIVTALSPWLLGDAVGPWRWSAVIIGFIGVMIVLGPKMTGGVAGLAPGTLFGIGAGVFYAIYVLTTRKMAGSDPALVTLVWTGVVGTLASSALLPSVWIMPSWVDLAIMVSLGLLAAIGHLMIIQAHEWASAPQLAPFGYVEIVAATIVGYLMFGDFPTETTWLGITIIVASGLVIAWREARLRAR